MRLPNPFVHCPGVFWPCVVDNVAHMMFRTSVRVERFAGPVCRWHDDAVEQHWMRELVGVEAQEYRTRFVFDQVKRARRVDRAKRVRSYK